MGALLDVTKESPSPKNHLNRTASGEDEFVKVIAVFKGGGCGETEKLALGLPNTVTVFVTESTMLQVAESMTFKVILNCVVVVTEYVCCGLGSVDMGLPSPKFQKNCCPPSDWFVGMIVCGVQPFGGVANFAFTNAATFKDNSKKSGELQ